MLVTPYFSYMLFARPPGEALATIAGIRDDLGPMRSTIGDERLHMTLVLIEQCQERNEVLPGRVATAFADHDLSACPVVYSRLVIEPGIAKLKTGSRHRGLKSLQASASERLTSHGIRPYPKGFDPHTTLGYEPAAAAGTRNVDRICWTIDELLLVESWVGRTQHRVLGRWPLLRGIDGSQYCFDF